jgi:glutathione synthase/RimK-type ligase-like ATP-grasp enzyme
MSGWERLINPHRIAVLRCARLPAFVEVDVPDFDALFAEDDRVIDAFRAIGDDAAGVAWDDATIDWSRFDIALIRSTWDYLDDPDGFRRVLERIEQSGCRLFNPRATVLWNMDKRYLLDLEAAGIPIVPTWPARAADGSPHLEALRASCRETGRDTIVLKPAVGLGAAYTHRVPLDDLDRMLAELATTQPGRDYLAQPYLDAIATEGEWSFFYFGGRPAHVLLKTPAPGDYRVQAHWGGRIARAEPSPRDRARADALMAALPAGTVYARLDFVRLDGELCVMEAELIEPVLSLELAPESTPLLVQATRTAANGG